MKTLTFALVDTVSLVVFTAVVLHTHRVGITALTVLRDLGPLLASWYVLAPVSRIYRRPGWGSLLLNWALAVPTGVLVRQVLFGRPLGRGTLVFLLAALAFTLLFLLAGRLIANFVHTRRSSQSQLIGVGAGDRREPVSERAEQVLAAHLRKRRTR